MLRMLTQTMAGSSSGCSVCARAERQHTKGQRVDDFQTCTTMGRRRAHEIITNGPFELEFRSGKENYNNYSTTIHLIYKNRRGREGEAPGSASSTSPRGVAVGGGSRSDSRGTCTFLRKLARARASGLVVELLHLAGWLAGSIIHHQRARARG